MPEVRKTEIKPATMTAAQRGVFFDEFFAVYNSIFDGYGREELEANFDSEDVVASRIQIIRDAAGFMIGFNAVRLYRYELLGRPCDIFRSIAGMRPEHRGKSSTILFGLQVAAAHRLRHPLRPIYYFGSQLHPSSYRVLSKYAHTIWPRHDRRTPENVDHLMAELADARGYRFDDPPSPYVRLAPERTRQCEAERDFWEKSQVPSVRFYLKTNPRYPEGRGLITLIPLTWANILLSGARFAVTMLRRRFR